MGNRSRIAARVAVLIACGLGVSACTSRIHLPTTPRVLMGEARRHAIERLTSLGRGWFEVSATIRYRTERQRPGQPLSPHQCLRQLVGGSIDRQTGLRMCDRSGEMTLFWDPPERWRMDVSGRTEDLTFLSTPARSSICRSAAGGEPGCVDVPADDPGRAAPFRALLEPPEQLLEEIGVDRSEASIRVWARRIAGVVVACFDVAAGSGESGAAWCYSEEGVVLSLAVRTGSRSPTTMEAIDVSTGPSDAVFAPP